MTTFDVHQHLWPSEAVELLLRRPSPPRIADGTVEIPGRRPFPWRPAAHDPEQRVAQLDRDGIDVAVISLSPTDRFDAELRDAWEEGILRVAASSGGRLMPIAAGRPRSGFAGTCITAAEAVAGDPETAGGVVFVHPGPEPPAEGLPGWWAGAVGYAAQMQAALLAWLWRPRRGSSPPAIFSILGGGGAMLLERLAARGAGTPPSFRDVYLETASFGAVGIGLCRDAVGAGALLFGSDRPVLDPAVTLAAVRALGDDAELVLADTPGRLFPRPSGDHR